MKLLLLALLPVALGSWVKEMEDEKLYEGDMILTPKQEEERKYGVFGYGSTSDRKWPKSGSFVTVPYAMDSSISSSSQAVNAINAAFADFKKYTCLRFVRRTNQRNYIYFYKGQGCSSYVGMIGGRQTVNLAGGCWARSTVIHEVLHALGFQHEQSRPDRDNFLTIRWENISPSMQFNFHKSNRVNSLGTKFDYRSVMHYGKTAFGGGKVTMQTKDPYFTDLIGVGSGFSDIDVKQINLLYQCPKYTGPSPDPNPQTPDCHDADSYCEMRVLAYGCDRVKHYCPYSCNNCKSNPSCKDESRSCHKYTRYCKNSHWQNWQKKYCARTCKFC